MSVSLALVPLAPQARLSSKAIRADLAAKWPDLPAPESTQAEKDQVAMRLGDQDVIIALMPGPIPWSDLEGPCRTSWLWPNAESDLKDHTTHLIVTVLSPAGPIERSRLLTQVCASILATCQQAPGVFWSNAALLVPSAVFQEFATRVLPDGPPLYIWVDVRVGAADKKGSAGQPVSAGFTSGMAALGHMEFETKSSPEPPAELRERFFALANYVLEHGPVINDGDTVGENADKRIRVVYAKSAFGHPGQVLQLQYSSSRPRKSRSGG